MPGNGDQGERKDEEKCGADGFGEANSEGEEVALVWNVDPCPGSGAGFSVGLTGGDQPRRQEQQQQPQQEDQTRGPEYQPTPLPPPGGFSMTFPDDDLGEGRDEKGFDISALSHQVRDTPRKEQRM